jgi:lipoprotein-releasing system ATP-binding protein
MSEIILSAKQISKYYQNFQVLNQVNLEIKKAEIVSLVGRSGAGKSTLLRILGTIDTPDSGTVNIANQNISSLSENNLAKFRNTTIGFVFQFHNLLSEFTVLENVLIPSLMYPKLHGNAQERAKELLNTLGIYHKANNMPSELSGGEQQRVAVARALINSPSIVFADEPSGNLDIKNANELNELFFRLREQYQQTFLIVTHNSSLAEMADRKLEIQDGLLIT